MHTSTIEILILEDDTLFAESLEDFLSEEGFAITLADDGEKALDLTYEKHFDLLLLDVNVPKLSGFELLQTLRQNQQNTPAIFITSFKDKKSIQKGFLMGGDDYMSKPVDVDELYLRILALLKRSGKLQESIMIGTAIYLPKEGVLTQNNTQHQLSKKVLLLLDLLLENPNQLVPISCINDTLWSWDETPSASSLRVYINELKKILGKEHIINHKAQGYKLALSR